MSIVNDEWWRAVLGEFPTGVALVSAKLPDGEPVAMVAGSFVAISQDPPLIGYFGDDASTTFRSLVGAKRFAVSVFGEAHDGLLRSFIRKDEGRYRQPGLTTTEHGLVMLEDSLAWFEATTQSVERYGDHHLVVGRVEGFGVGSPGAGSPLIYRRGGFGTFTVPADDVDARLVGESLAAAQSAAEVLAPIAGRIERDIAITSLVGESVVVVGMVPAGPAARPVVQLPGAGTPDPLQAIGISLPFAAPVEPVFAAWAPERTRSLWIERARHLFGGVDRGKVEAQLAAIRESGYAVSVDQDLTARFFSLVTDPSVERESYAKVWSEYAARIVESVNAGIPLSDISAIQVPVFDDRGGVALVLTVSDLGPFDDVAEIAAFAAALIEAARTVSKAIVRQPRGRS